MGDIFRIAICDDEEIYGEQCSNLCRDFFYTKKRQISVRQYHSALALMQDNIKHELIFLDIEMPEMTGIEAKNKLAEIQPQAIIIFMTRHKEYMREAFGKNVYYFLDKPLDKSQFDQALQGVYRECFEVQQIEIDEKHIVLIKQSICYDSNS